MTMTRRPNATFIALLAAVLATPYAAARAADYPREFIYDTAAGTDEALVNVSLVNHRWPDCTTLESAIRDIFRIEGVTRKPDQDKALALWKWFRILVSSTGGGYAYEGPRGRERIVYDPHKILTVYGHHQCDGLSWAMAPLWRAAGYMAFDECTHGHTTAALRYRDADRHWRYHSFDPQGRFYYWDPKAERVATRTVPVMTAMVYRHVTAPQRLHSLRTSLRIGEAIERRWSNGACVVPSGRPGKPVHPKYYEFRYGRTDGIYAVAGQESQHFGPWPDPKVLRGQLAEGSANVNCTGSGKTLYGPAEAGKPAIFIFRLPPPYVAVEAHFKATLHKARDGDVCNVYLSRDGRPWQRVFEKTRTGPEGVRIDMGRKARTSGKPNAYTAYDIRIKVEMVAAGKPGDVGMSSPSIAVRRMLNKRTLPNLMPGENVFRVAADRIAPGWALRLRLSYRLKGKVAACEHVIGRFPYYFRIDAPGVKLRTIGNYDQDFGNEAVRMLRYRMELVPTRGAKLTRSLPAEKADAAFAKACPHPADMTKRRTPKVLEADPMQTSGFFPQSRAVLKDTDRMNALIRQLNSSGDSSYKAWAAAQELGAYPESVDHLCNRLGNANIDLTLFLCKALAQIGDRRAVEPLLARWAEVPKGAPGTRYIPDALAAIGDRRVVPALVRPLKRVRFDFRFHVARALGILGGPEAAAALRDLAANDPFPAVRAEAKAALEKLKGRSK